MLLIVTFTVYQDFMSEKEDAQRDFGQMIRLSRESRNLSQSGLAKLTDMERQQIYRIENGLSGTRRDTVLRLAEALHINVGDALKKAGYAPEEKEDSSIPRPILDAIGRSGDLSDSDSELIAGFIEVLKKQREQEARRNWLRAFAGW